MPQCQTLCWGCSSVAEYRPNTQQTPGLIPSTAYIRMLTQERSSLSGCRSASEGNSMSHDTISWVYGTREPKLNILIFIIYLIIGCQKIVLSNHLTKGPFTIYELYSIIYIYSSHDILKYTHIFLCACQGVHKLPQAPCCKVRNNKCLYHWAISKVSSQLF